MSATTLKIESPLLDELKRVCPKGKSISAFVRSVLEQVIHKQRMSKALQEYQSFLDVHPEELAWLGNWEVADLTRPPKPSHKKKS